MNGPKFLSDATPLAKTFDQLVKRFLLLCQGRTDVWGALHGQAVKERVTPAHYARHLQGRTSLGIYPRSPEGVVRWFAADIDHQDPETAVRLMKALADLDIDQGLCLELSKGKGFHINLLLSNWTPAPLVRRIAKVALQESGLPPSTENFPKQDRLTQQTPWGNYLNLPYFGGVNSGGSREENQ